MKAIIQIPAFNEAASIGAVIDALPKAIPGVDAIEVLLVDDGSTDGTGDIARAHGAHHVVRHAGNRGLAAAFQTGLDACLRLGADVIVNTDADGQYPGAAIPGLVAPIVAGQADLVIGDRRVQSVPHFTWQKKLLQRVGSWVVRLASGTDVPDAPSGFRAYSREAALRLIVTSDFSYTVEHVLQAGRHRLAVTHVPVQAVPTARPSRLYRSTWSFVSQQALTILRTYATYQPLRTFFYLGLPFLLAGLILLGRLAVIFILEGFEIAGHLQSLTAGVAALILGFLMLQFGLLADRIGDNRRLLEETLYRMRRHELDHRSQAEAPPARPPDASGSGGSQAGG